LRDWGAFQYGFLQTRCVSCHPTNSVKVLGTTTTMVIIFGVC